MNKNHYLTILILTFLVWTGCSSKQKFLEEENTNTLHNSSYTVSEEGHLYENELYNFRVTLPATAEIISDLAINPKASSDSLYNVSFYLEANMNSNINVYPANTSNTELKEIKNTPDTYRYHKIELDKKIEAWQTEPQPGTSNYWFLNTVLFTPEYIYTIQSSKDLRDEDFIQKHEQIIKSFEAYKDLR